MSPLEQVLQQAVSRNGDADFSKQKAQFLDSGTDEPLLDAELLRLLFLGLRPTNFPDDCNPLNTSRWTIRGATIAGRLDLADGRRLGGAPLPSLTFIDCVFRECFCADNAYIGSLTLRTCTFASRPAGDLTPQLSLRNLRCDDELLLDGINALQPGDYFVLDARAIRTGAAVIIRNSTFHALPNLEIGDPLGSAYAVTLRGADIHGDLFVEPSVRVFGGFTAANARIGGTVRMAGLQATDGYDDEFRTTLKGMSTVGVREAVTLCNANVGGNVLLGTLRAEQPFQCTGPVLLETVQINGNLFLLGVDIKGTGLDQKLLSLIAAKVRGFLQCVESDSSLPVFQNSVQGVVSLSSLEVGGLFTFHGRFGSVVAGNIIVEGNAEFWDLREASPSDAAAPEITSSLDLSGASVGGGLTIGNLIKRPTPAAMKVRTRSLTLNLNTSIVRHGLKLSGQYSKINGINLAVSDDIDLYNDVFFSLDLANARIGGTLNLSNFHFSYRGFGSQLGRPYFDLSNAEIKGALKLGLSPQDMEAIAFRSSRMALPPCYPSLRVVEVEASRSESSTQSEQSYWAAYLVGKNGVASPLDGNSRIFHEANKAGRRSFRNDDEIADYLRIFCAYVWGDEGAFQIVEKTSQIHGEVLKGDLATIRALSPEKASGRAVGQAPDEIVSRTPASILYEDTLFTVTLEMPRNGIIRMGNDDTAVAKLDASEQDAYVPPLRHGPHADESDYFPMRGWTKLSSEEELSALVPRWKDSFRQTASFANAVIDLRNTSCATLEDGDGTAWGTEVQLYLDNFHYTQLAAAQHDMERSRGLLWNIGERTARTAWRIRQCIRLAFLRLELFGRRFLGLRSAAVPDLRQVFAGGEPNWFINIKTGRPRKTGVRDRLGWLEQRPILQTISHPTFGVPTEVREGFLSQPYAQLAKVFREQGDESAAKRVEEQRIHSEHWIRARDTFSGKLFLPVAGAFRVGFRYGLSPARATLTFIAFLLLGWVAVHIANHHPKEPTLLTQNTQISSTLASKSATGIITALPMATSQQGLVSDIPCGDSINEFLYSVDVFIPLLDLRQEPRCDIRPFEVTDKHPMEAYHLTKGRISAKFFSWLNAFALDPIFWQWLKAIYAVLGWIVTSLTILTYSGALRKWDQN